MSIRWWCRCRFFPFGKTLFHVINCYILSNFGFSSPLWFLRSLRNGLWRRIVWIISQLNDPVRNSPLASLHASLPIMDLKGSFVKWVPSTWFKYCLFLSNIIIYISSISFTLLSYALRMRLGIVFQSCGLFTRTSMNLRPFFVVILV